MFRTSLALDNKQNMNEPDNGVCCTNRFAEYENYGVATDADGNSVLTGDGAGKEDHMKTFTLVAIETWQLNY